MSEPDLHAAFGSLLHEGRVDPGLDAAAFAGWAGRHRIAAYASLLAGQSDARLAAALRPHRLGATAAEARRSHWILPLLRAMAAAGAPPIAFKGLGVAHFVYPSPELRPLGDLDLLVPGPHLDAATAAARDLGFCHPSEDPAVLAYHREDQHHLPLHHPVHGLLELHHRLYRDFSPRFAGEILDRSRPAHIGGVAVRALDSVDLFLVLAVHFAVKDPGSCWMWLLDLVLLHRQMDAQERRALGERACDAGMELFVSLALEAMAELWNVERPDELARLARGLRPLERRLVARVPGLRQGAVLAGDLVRLTRRLSGRAVDRAGGPLGALLCHPGQVCMELGVCSSSRWFPLHRARHALKRAGRLGRALGASLHAVPRDRP